MHSLYLAQTYTSLWAKNEDFINLILSWRGTIFEAKIRVIRSLHVNNNRLYIISQACKVIFIVHMQASNISLALYWSNHKTLKLKLAIAYISSCTYAWNIKSAIRCAGRCIPCRITVDEVTNWQNVAHQNTIHHCLFDVILILSGIQPRTHGVIFFLFPLTISILCRNENNTSTPLHKWHARLAKILTHAGLRWYRSIQRLER